MTPERLERSEGLLLNLGIIKGDDMKYLGYCYFYLGAIKTQLQLQVNLNYLIVLEL